MKTFNFYDTNALLLKRDHIFAEETVPVISSITLNELENIKTSTDKDEEIKYHAREVLRILNNNFYNHNYEVVIYQENMWNYFKEVGYDFPHTNDIKILLCALYYDKHIHPDEVKFYTNDLALKHIANLFFGEDSVLSVSEEQSPDTYCGYQEFSLNEEQMANFYQDLNQNILSLKQGEYAIIKDQENNIVDKLCWTGETMRNLNFSSFESRQLGLIKPYKNDVYQMLAADSLTNNQITMLKGPAGSGKTLLALGRLFSQMEKGKIDKIIIFCNPVATRNSARLGFYPGTRESKLLDSQIGNLLMGKLGDRMAAERLINEGKLILLPLSDIRGFDTTGMKSGVYISEAQNMDITLMKLALQRIGEDSVCIIDGDDKTQVDMREFAAEANGMRRASQILRGTEIYGEVELKTIHRSKLANIVEKM